MTRDEAKRRLKSVQERMASVTQDEVNSAVEGAKAEIRKERAKDAQKREKSRRRASA